MHRSDSWNGTLWLRATMHSCARVSCREYWTIYRGPSFLAAVLFSSTPTPLPRLTGRPRKRENLLTVRDRLGRGRARSRIIRAWSSINHSIFSAWSRACVTSTWSVRTPEMETKIESIIVYTSTQYTYTLECQYPFCLSRTWDKICS